ncbi:MAG TPA: hypothetical protein VHD34_08850 [Xanthobacteraceae bacterium]|nr:hypothetical protein [Xanthobacteraceae bacterium]
MGYSDSDLRAAAAAGIIDSASADKLIDFLAARGPSSSAAPVPKFDAAHLLWYAGALIVIGAMGMFSTLAYSQMGGTALTATAIAYAIAFTLVGHNLWHKRDLKTPGGLLITIAVSMAPLAIYGIQEELGWWGKFGKPGTVHDFYTWIKGSWVFMEIGTVAAGVIALRFFRFPFIVAVIAVALWFMSMDIVPWIAGDAKPSWELKRQVSVWFGLAVLVVAWGVDYRGRDADFAFWLHLFGLMAFWGGITATESSNEFGKAMYCLMNVGLLFVAIFIVRRAYAVFGAFGISAYLSHLAEVVFKNSLLFPFALSLIGVGVIAAGLIYHRKQQAIRAWFNANLPEALLRLRPASVR